jgi:glycosyltransferase involved in cell wall biosynthesis
MSHRPVVSVIIPFFNAQKFIQEAIESVFAQTYEHWELILIDDGSNDRTSETARRYADDHSEKVVYLEHQDHQNRGACASRNLGVRHARGEYIALLDADDVWLPLKLEQQVTLMHKHPEAAVIYGASQYWHSWTGAPEDQLRDYMPRLGVGPDAVIWPPTLLTLSLKSIARTPCPSDFLSRRGIVEEVGGFEERFCGVYQLFEDQAFLAKVFLKAPVFVSGACWDRYRQHPESCVSVAARDGKKYLAGLFYLRWLEGYLSAQGNRDDELWAALRNKRFRYRYPRLHRLVGSAQRRLKQTKEIVRAIAR